MKDNYSLLEYATVLNDASDTEIYSKNEEFNMDKINKTRTNVAKIFMRTKGDGLSNSGIEIAVAGICRAMERSSKPVRDFVVPLHITKEILWNIVNSQKYKSKEEFLNAPLVGFRISQTSLYLEESFSNYTSEGMSTDKAVSAFENSLDYAIFQKLWMNYLGGRNSEMPANKFVREFGGVDQDEIQSLYRSFADEAFQTINYWREQKKEYAPIPDWLFGEVERGEEEPIEEPEVGPLGWLFNPSN
jgi:hypothetical protein